MILIHVHNIPWMLMIVMVCIQLIILCQLMPLQDFGPWHTSLLDSCPQQFLLDISPLQPLSFSGHQSIPRSRRSHSWSDLFVSVFYTTRLSNRWRNQSPIPSSILNHSVQFHTDMMICTGASFLSEMHLVMLLIIRSSLWTSSRSDFLIWLSPTSKSGARFPH